MNKTEGKPRKKLKGLFTGIHLLTACFLLAACGTARTMEFPDHKEIYYEGFTQAPTQHEVRSTMEALSMKECPNGYQVISQRHSDWPRSVVWKVKCN